jgi:hypothetical protein
MKLKAIYAAVALCAMTGAAHAIDPSAAAGFDTIGAAVNINAAGATAQDKAVLGHVLTNLCTGNIDLFTNNTPAQVAASTFVGTNDTAVSCDTTEARLDFDANGDTDKADNTTFMFRKLSAGGSANGVIPVANGAAPTQTSRAVNTGNCTSQGTFTVQGTANVQVWTCGATGAQAVVPTVGFSDVEPALFVAGGPNAIGAFNVADLNTLPTLSLTFGVPVTLNLRNALQGAQGLTVGSDSLANMPSLTRSQITSLYAGKIGSWNVFESETGTKLATGAAVPPLNDRVHVCRRTVGSGTQAQANALFLDTPCAGDNKLNFPSDNTPLTTVTATGTYTVLPAAGAAAIHENTSSGNVTTCLNTLQTNNQWGIGLQSLELGSDSWRFVKIDGALPTTEQVAGNTYFDWAENVINVKASEPATSASRAFFTNFRPAQDLAELNATFNPRITEVSAATANGRCDTGEVCVGYLYPFNAPAASVPAPFDNAVPTMSATRGGLSGTSSPSMCRQPVIQTDSVLATGM